MKKRFFIGIDPGEGGCAVCLDDEGDIEFLLDYPGDPIACYKELEFKIISLGIQNALNITAALEKVHGRPPMGAAAAFTFGANWATWRMILVSLQIPFEEPSPNIWQKGMFKKSDEIKGNKKSRSLTVARRLWPESYKYFKNLGDNNRSDAALIAKWLLNQRRVK